MNTFIKGITGRKGHQQCQRHHFSSITNYCRGPFTASLRKKTQHLNLARDVKPSEFIRKTEIFKTICILGDLILCTLQNEAHHLIPALLVCTVAEEQQKKTNKPNKKKDAAWLKSAARRSQKDSMCL